MRLFIVDILYSVASSITDSIRKLSFLTSNTYSSLFANDMNEEDRTNIFNQQNNPSYLLQDNDIHQILQQTHPNIAILPFVIQDITKVNLSFHQNPLETPKDQIEAGKQHLNESDIDERPNIAPDERIFDNTKQIRDALVTAINSLYHSSELTTIAVKDTPPLKSHHFIVNINNNHWTCLSLVKTEDNNLYILYKDSAEISLQTRTQIELYIKNIALIESVKEEKIKFLANTHQEQQDSTSCGIFALKNIEIIQQNLSKENANDFLKNFTDYKEFCQSSNVPSLYKKYAKEYLASQIKSILRESQPLDLTTDKINKILKENLYISGNKTLEKEINTFVKSYNPNKQLEKAFSTTPYYSIWLLNKNHYPKTYTFQENHNFIEITGAEDYQ